MTCSCTGSQPTPSANPAGLDHVSYRANDFAGFRQALLTPLPGEQELTGWSPGPEDLGLQVLEWWAYLADVLTFYNERIANNDYLRTAAAQPRPKRNVAGLARLLGHVPRPGITAKGVIAAIRSSGQPGQQLVIPTGTQIISTPAAGAPAQLFETGLTLGGETAAFIGPSDGLIVLPPDPELFQPSIAAISPVQGLKGTVVTITGAGLTAATAVNFGGNPATIVTILSDTQLTAVVPAQAASGPVTVNTSFGAAASHDPFVVTADGGQLVALTATTKSVLLAGQVTVTPGEQLVLVHRNWHGDHGNWAVVTVGAATTEPDPNGPPNTRLILNSTSWNRLGDAFPRKATDYRLLRATATAQLWTMPAIHPPTTGGTGGTSGGSGSGGSGGTGSGGSGGGGLQAGHPLKTTASPTPVTFTVPLATLVRNVSTGDNVLFTGSTRHPAGTLQLLAHVHRYEEVVTRTRAALQRPVSTSNPIVVMPHTRLTVHATGNDAPALEAAVEDADLGGVTMRYGFREVGTLIPTPAPSLDGFPATVTAPSGLVLPTNDSVDVALQDATGTGVLVSAALVSGSFQLTALSDQPDPVLPLTAPIRLFADLVAVSRGATVRDEILGNGDPAIAGQVFVLQHSPLIYLPADKPADRPFTTTLVVVVDGVAWQEVPAFAGQPPGAQVYLIRELPDGHIQVRFGDGLNGARLPLGVSNVTATYRYGAAATPPPPGHLSTVLQPQPGLASVLNPVSITPGIDPESARQTADAAPGKALLLAAATSPQAPAPPLISPGDYENFARTVSSVVGARAYWGWDTICQCPDIQLYVRGSGASENAAATVREALRGRPDSRVPVQVRRARAIPLHIQSELLSPRPADIDAIETAAARALTDHNTGLFSARQMGIGQRLHRSQVEAALASSGAIAIISLAIERPDPPQGEPALTGHGESDLDPGQDGYFVLHASDLQVKAVPQ